MLKPYFAYVNMVLTRIKLSPPETFHLRNFILWEGTVGKIKEVTLSTLKDSQHNLIKYSTVFLIKPRKKFNMRQLISYSATGKYAWYVEQEIQDQLELVLSQNIGAILCVLL